MSESTDANSQIGIVNHEGKVISTKVPEVQRSPISPGEPKFRQEDIIRQRKGKLSKSPSLVRIHK